jgi:hypothetical protein
MILSSLPLVPNPYQHATLLEIPSLISWSAFAALLLPYCREIQFGAKEDGPPRWTLFLESWFLAIDPLVWELRKYDDEQDERVKREIRTLGLRLLEEKAAEEKNKKLSCQHSSSLSGDIKKLSCQYSCLLSRRLLRRERIYGSSCSSLLSSPPLPPS